MAKDKQATPLPANLDSLKIGEGGEIMAISGERSLRRNLMEMGLIEGSKIRIIKFGPQGDPIQIQINDYVLSLRKNEASRIIIK